MYKYYQQPRLPCNGEIFVFGSNSRGRHGKGAAKTAYWKYGAIYGVGVGLMNQSYAIPTKDRFINVLPLHDIVPFIHEFVQFTIEHPHMLFYVTPVGTGLAGYDVQDIAPHFKDAINCEFPLSFKPYLEDESID